MAELAKDSPAFAHVLALLDERPVSGIGLSGAERGRAAGYQPGEWVVANDHGVIARGNDLDTLLTQVAFEDRTALAIGFIGPPAAAANPGGGGTILPPIDPLILVNIRNAVTGIAFLSSDATLNENI